MSSILKQVRFLQQIQQALRPVLTQSGAEHVGVADYSDGHLVLIADSGSWATRLKYQQEIVRRALAQSLRLDLHTLDVRVRPPVSYGSQPAPSKPRRISDASRRHLADSARYTDDPGLARALRRLASCQGGAG